MSYTHKITIPVIIEVEVFVTASDDALSEVTSGDILVAVQNEVNRVSQLSGTSPNAFTEALGDWTDTDDWETEALEGFDEGDRTDPKDERDE